MVRIEDYFKKGMSEDEYDDALVEFADACEDEGQKIPLWVRMELDEEVVTVPDDLKKALAEIDEEFGVKG